MRNLLTCIVLSVLPAILCSGQNSSVDSRRLQEAISKAYHQYLANPDSAILMASQTAELAKQINNTVEEGRSYMVISKAYWAKGNYLLSTDFGFRSLKLLQMAPEKGALAHAQLALGRTLAEIGNHSKAAEYIRQSIVNAKQIQDTLLMAEGFREYSFLWAELKQYDSALQYADMGIPIFKKYHQLADLSILYGRKSRIFFELKDYARSKSFAYMGLPLDSIAGNKRGFAISKLLVAQSEREFGNLKKALTLAKSSVSINQEINNSAWLIRGHQFIAALYQDMGDYKKANEELRLAMIYKDSLFNAEKNSQAYEMQALYELDSKQKTIQLLENENKLKEEQNTNQKLFLFILLISILSLLVIIFILSRLRVLQERSNKSLTVQKEEIQRQAENLRQLNELKTKLFSVISHDLRGPVNNLHSLLSMLTSKVMTPEEFLHFSGKLKANLEGTQSNLENLLNWCLTQMDGIKTNTERIELGMALNQSINLVADVAHGKNIVFKKSYPPTAAVLADANQVQLIFRNLLQNAIKFSNAKSEIDISATEQGDYWRIVVKDSGIGMNTEEIHKVLNSNEYFTKAGTHQEKGTGLGLLLCKDFIKLNKGKLEIESIPGDGTSIAVLLPKANP